MRLFAIVAVTDENGHLFNDRDVVHEYLQRQFSDELVKKYLHLFDHSLREYHQDIRITASVKAYERSAIIRHLCQHLNNELEQSQKISILIFLLDFINRGIAITDFEHEFLHQVAQDLRIGESELRDAQSFTFDETEKVTNQSNLLFIDSKPSLKQQQIKHIRIDKVEGRLKGLHINSTNTYVLRYDGSQIMTLNGHVIKSNRSYIWAVGSVIKNSRFGSIYYTWIAGRFIQETSDSSFVFEAKSIEYRYGNSQNGIKPFNLNEESGRLIGIIGGSGSGKSTLLKLLSGVLKPRRGSITINGLNIHDHARELKGVIGYVPQDDVLIKELTVFENLYMNARLSFSQLGESKIKEVVEKALLNFDLVEARDLRVGDALNTYLSGGQRKRLNIALELIREPAVLFVDEPTSGLSSADSEKVMNLLKRQTFKGKLVFANIHQPSTEIFRLLDKLLVVDQGGRIIYYGNPLEAVNYFKRAGHYVDAEESECLSCGNISVDQILRNVEARVVDVNGRLTRNRKTSPSEWYSLYMERIDPLIRQIKRPFTNVVPRSLYKIPSRWQQIRIFFKRDILAKLKNRQYLIVTLLEAPVLALILSFYTRSSRDASGMFTHYSFGLNPNIPAYLFMAVIVALFLGLVISAEEIFRDRKIMERERFLSLSRISYLSSKVVILFGISAIQMGLFVLIGNSMLVISHMTWRYFLIMFSTSCLANLLGLNISSGFKSVVTIYILVPLILVPQLLFSGVVVDFQNLNKSIYSPFSVPAIGDAMTSRWAFETFMVTQYKDNPYERDIFPYEWDMNYYMFKKAWVIPEIRERLDSLEKSPDAMQEKELRSSALIRNEVYKISRDLKNIPYPGFTKENNTRLNPDEIHRIRNYLNRSWQTYHSRYLSAMKTRDQILNEKYRDRDLLLADKRKYANNKLESLVRNEDELVEYVIDRDQIIRLKNPIYTKPILENGRSHFYSAWKNIRGLKIDTFWFNLMVIWISVMLWFVVLYFDLVRKLFTYFENIKLQRFNQRVFKILKQSERRV